MSKQNRGMMGPGMGPPRTAAPPPGRDPNRGNPNAEFDMSQLDRLDKMMVVVACLGLIVNVVQVTAISNHAWLKATALSDGQAFTAHLSLASARFGDGLKAGQDNRYFCQSRSDECSLAELCKKDVSTAVYPNGAPKFTPSSAWCDASDAGSTATKFLFSGLLLGLGATAMTGMYAAQSIPWVADQFDKVEELGFSDEIQKYLIFAGWSALWVFIFCSMVAYATMIPDSLGWGTVELEASFGLLRVCFVLSSLNVAVVANSVFHLWGDDALKTAWDGFMAVPWLSPKKALYIELAIQLALYFMMVVDEVDWAVLLVVIAFIYLGSGQKSFMIMYVTIIIISILFDTIKLLSLPSLDTMTPGESWGAMTWMSVYVLKFLIVGTIVANEYLEAGGKSSAAPAGGYGRQQDEYYDDEPAA